MIYVITSGDYLKVGYSKNVCTRLKSYETSNPDVNVISYSSGSISDEKDLHEKLKSFHHRNEWFHKTSESLNIIHNEFTLEKALAKQENVKQIGIVRYWQSNFSDGTIAATPNSNLIKITSSEVELINTIENFEDILVIRDFNQDSFKTLESLITKNLIEPVFYIDNKVYLKSAINTKEDLLLKITNQTIREIDSVRKNIHFFIEDRVGLQEKSTKFVNIINDEDCKYYYKTMYKCYYYFCLENNIYLFNNLYSLSKLKES